MERAGRSGPNFSRAPGRAGAYFAGDWTAERIKTPFILPILCCQFTVKTNGAFLATNLVQSMTGPGRLLPVVPIRFGVFGRLLSSRKQPFAGF